MKNILKTGIITTLSVVFFGITNQANAGLIGDCMSNLSTNNYLIAETAISYGKKAVKAKPNNIWAYLCLATAYLENEQYNRAIKYSKIAGKHTTSNNILSFIYSLEGASYWGMDNYNEALLYNSKALSLDTKLGNRKKEALDLNNIGDLYQDLGVSDMNTLNKALEFYKRALSLSDEKDKGEIYDSIANIYSIMVNPVTDSKKVIKYEMKAIKIDKKFGNYYQLARDYLHLSDYYMENHSYLGLPTKVKDYALKGLQYAEEGGDQGLMAEAYDYLSIIYSIRGNNMLAQQYQEEYMDIHALPGGKPKYMRSVLYLNNHLKKLYQKTKIVTKPSITNQAYVGLIKKCLNFIITHHYSKASNIAIDVDMAKPNSSWVHLCFGSIDLDAGSHDDTIAEARIAEKYAMSKSTLAATYNLEGMGYESIGNFNNALLYQGKALSLAIESGGTGKKEKDSNNIAMLYYKTGIEYYKRAIQIDQGLGNYHQLAKDYLMLGSNYILIRNFAKAKNDLDKGILMEKKFGNLKWQGAGYIYLSMLFLAEGDKANAKGYWSKALDIFASISDKSEASDIMDVLKKVDENQWNKDDDKKHL